MKEGWDVRKLLLDHYEIQLKCEQTTTKHAKVKRERDEFISVYNRERFNGFLTNKERLTSHLSSLLNIRRNSYTYT